MVIKTPSTNPYANTYGQLGQVQNPSTNPYANTYGLSQEHLRQYMPPGAHTHTINPALPVHTSMPSVKGDQYSIAEVQLVSGGMIGMTINASIRIADHLLKTMKETGFLHLRNEAEAIVLRAEDVRAFKLTQLTTEG